MDAKGEQAAFVYTTYIQETPERVWQGLAANGYPPGPRPCSFDQKIVPNGRRRGEEAARGSKPAPSGRRG